MTTSTRPPNAAVAWTLIATTWLSTVAVTLLAPLLPEMTRSFASWRDVNIKISLVATLPALFIAVLAVPAGYLGDRFGHKKLLLGAVAIYGIVGVSPLFLTSLDLIVASRAAVGVTEAVIMTAANALIATYFMGGERQKWLALETGTSPIVATAAMAVGGVFGQSSWRIPFGLYGVAFLMVPAVALLLPRVASAKREEQASDETFNAIGLAGLCAITLLGSTAFYVTIIQFGFLFESKGPSTPQVIGLWAAVSSIGSPLGALVFGVMRTRSMAKLAASLALFAVGCAIMAIFPEQDAMIGGAFLANLAGGRFLPTMINWALASLPISRKGLGIGAWTTAFFLGEFASPLAVLWLRGGTGSLDGAVAVFGALALLGAIAALTTVVRTRAQRP